MKKFSVTVRAPGLEQIESVRQIAANRFESPTTRALAELVIAQQTQLEGVMKLLADYFQAKGELESVKVAPAGANQSFNR